MYSSGFVPKTQKIISPGTRVLKHDLDFNAYITIVYPIKRPHMCCFHHGNFETSYVSHVIVFRNKSYAGASKGSISLCFCFNES